MTRLYRSRNNILGGVCGGLAEVFDLDPSIVRILWMVFALVAGWGFIIYIIAWIVVPKKEFVFAESARSAAHTAQSPETDNADARAGAPENRCESEGTR